MDGNIFLIYFIDVLCLVKYLKLGIFWLLNFCKKLNWNLLIDIIINFGDLCIGFVLLWLKIYDYIINVKINIVILYWFKNVMMEDGVRRKYENELGNYIYIVF